MATIEERKAAAKTAGLASLDTAKTIQAKAAAAHRDLTDDEQQAVTDALTKAKAQLDIINGLDRDAAVWDWAREFSDDVGLSIGGSGGARGAKSGQRLSFTGMAGTLARSIRPDGQKALSPSGAAVVGQSFAPDPVALGRPATSLLDVLPVVTHATPEISYLRQTTRTNAAAVVAAGALKPTSVYSVTRIEASLVVIAHLSEGIPRHWLLDNVALEQFLDNELRYGLAVAVEAKVLTDVNSTSGIQSQAYATSVLATLRKGVTKLETAGYTASAYVLHPTDWEGVELAVSSTNAVEHQGIPYDASRRTLFGVPVTTSNAQAAGVGHVIASGAVALDTDTRGVDVQYSENATADSFGKNLVLARCESRYNTSVFSPLGVVSLDLTP